MEVLRNRPKVELTAQQRKWAKAFIQALGGWNDDAVDFVKLETDPGEAELQGSLGNMFGVTQARDKLLADGSDEGIPSLARIGFAVNVVKPLQKLMENVDQLIKLGTPVSKDFVAGAIGHLTNYREKEENPQILAALDRRIDALNHLVEITNMSKDDRLEEINKLDIKQKAAVLAENPALLEAVIAAAPPDLTEILKLLPSNNKKVRKETSKQIVAFHSDAPEYVIEIIDDLMQVQTNKRELGTFLRSTLLVVDLLKDFSLTDGGEKFVSTFTDVAAEKLKSCKRKNDTSQIEKNKYKDNEDLGIVEAVNEVVVAILDHFLSTSVESMPKPLLICCSLMADGLIAAGGTYLDAIASIVGGHFFLRLVSPTITDLGAKKLQSGLTEDQAKIATRAAGVLQLISKGATPSGPAYEPLAKLLPLMEKMYLEMAQCGRKLRDLKPLDYEVFEVKGSNLISDWEDFGEYDESTTTKSRQKKTEDLTEKYLFDEEKVEEEEEELRLEDPIIEDTTTTRRETRVRGMGNTTSKPPLPIFRQKKREAGGIEENLLEEEDEDGLDPPDPLDKQKEDK